MIVHNLVQNSPEWHQFRAQHFGASEASAMLGLSPYKTRDELLREKAIGIFKEVDTHTQKIFDKGHEVERLALPIAEKMIGVELYPVTASKGDLSASCDGLSMDETVAWENKQYNKAHFEQVKNGELPEIHWPQCQQVMYVTGADMLWFTISDGTDGNTVGMWVHQDVKLQEKLVNGWAQFATDLKNYVPPVVIEKVEAETIQALPVPSVVVRGEITASNLSEITPKFDTYLASIKTEFKTDQDFADAEANAKNCRETAKRIEALQANIIAQMVSVNDINSVLENYKEAFNKVGLRLEKAAKEQKDLLKANAILTAQSKYIEFVNSLEKTLPFGIQVHLVKPNFADAIKGVKTIETMNSRLNDAVAKGSIEASTLATNVSIRLAYINEAIKGYEHLFAVHDLAFKDLDYIKLQIESVKAAEDKRKAEYEAQIKAKAEADALAMVQSQKLATQAVEEAKQEQKIVDIKTKLPEQIETVFKNLFESSDKDFITNLVAQAYAISSEQALNLIVRTFDIRKDG